MKPAAYDLWTRIRTGVEEGLTVLWKGTADVTLKTVAEADTVRLRLDARRLRTRHAEACRQLGRRVFDALAMDGGGGGEDFPESVRTLKEEIRRLEDELRTAEEEIVELKRLHLQR